MLHNLIILSLYHITLSIKLFVLRNVFNFRVYWKTESYYDANLVTEGTVCCHCKWKPRVIMMSIFSSLVALEVVVIACNLCRHHWRQSWLHENLADGKTMSTLAQVIVRSGDKLLPGPMLNKIGCPTMENKHLLFWILCEVMAIYREKNI